VHECDRRQTDRQTDHATKKCVHYHRKENKLSKMMCNNNFSKNKKKFSVAQIIVAAGQGPFPWLSHWTF